MEADIVVERLDRMAAQSANLIHLAVSAAQGSKKAANALNKHIKALTRT